MHPLYQMKPSPSIRAHIECGQKLAQRFASQRGKNRNRRITLCYRTAKNIKINNSKPFPGNRKEIMLIRRNIAAFHAKISRRMPSILHFHRRVIPANAGIQGKPAKDGFPLDAGMTRWERVSTIALKNIKIDKSKPFPGNRLSTMPFQREIAVFRAQISRRMLSILPFFDSQVVIYRARRKGAPPAKKRLPSGSKRVSLVTRRFMVGQRQIGRFANRSVGEIYFHDAIWMEKISSVGRTDAEIICNDR